VGSLDGEHAKLLTLTEAGGKTKAVTANGIADTRNDIMLYSSFMPKATRLLRRPSRSTLTSQSKVSIQ